MTEVAGSQSGRDAVSSEVAARIAGILAPVTTEPWKAGFFATLRQVERASTKHVPLGRSKRPEDDPVRLGQEPSLAFAPSTVSAVQPAKGRRPPRLSAHFLGLFGPNGPLPLHLTEYARQRIRNHKDYTFSAFADLFHHRVLSMFYRAWADARPAPSSDLEEKDPFAAHVRDLAGIGLPGLQERDALPDLVRMQNAGRIAAIAPTPDAIERMIVEQFGVPAAVVEFVGHWQPLADDDVCRLGSGDPRTSALGQSAVLGDSVWLVEDRFRVLLGPMDIAQYRSLRPESELGQRLHALVRSLVGRAMDFETQWIVRRDEVPPMHLDGTAGLGVDAFCVTQAHCYDPKVSSMASVDPAVTFVANDGEARLVGSSLDRVDDFPAPSLSVAKS